MWWIIPLLIGLVFVGALSFAAIQSWLESNRTPDSRYGELIKQKLRDGKYRVVAGVFNKRGHATATQSWETDHLDDDLQQRFGRRSKIKVEL